MKAKFFPSYFLSILLVLFFLFPYLSVFKFFDGQILINQTDLFWALKNSFLQSSVTALLSVGLGFFLAGGLLSLPQKLQSVFSKLILIPQILPSLFSILIAFALLNPFPMGHIGVIFIFLLINLGFSAFQINESIKNKMGQMALVSEIYGIRKFTFQSKILGPLLWPEIKLNFFMVFLFCFSSLSIPLVAGGGKGTNLEVLIFEKIFIDQNWDSAWVLMLLQTGFVFCISYLFLRNKSLAVKNFGMHSFYKSKLGAFGLVIYFLGFIGSYVLSVFHSFKIWEDMQPFFGDILQATKDSVVLVALTLAVCFGLLLLWTLDYVQTLRHNLSIHFISVSTVLVGFSFYILFPQEKSADLIKIPLAFTLLFFPVLFKIFFEKQIEQLKMQIVAAKVFGISKLNIVFGIIFNQFQKTIFLSASLLLIWALSDFAVSKALGTQTKTLGLFSESLLSSYRLEAAYLVSFYTLVIWLTLSGLIYFILKGIYGVDKKY